MEINEKDVLIVVDMQNDFCDRKGSLYVPGGEYLIPVINKLMRKFDNVILTQDWHPQDHISFSKWPAHCVAGTYGAAFPPNLDTQEAFLIIRKGMEKDTESYSAFMDERVRVSGLNSLLDAREFIRVFVCGLATDFCVAETAIHAARWRKTYFISDACRAVNVDGSYAGALFRMGAGHVGLVNSKEILDVQSSQ